MIGTMRYKLTVQQLTATPDGTGGTSATWANLKSLFAEVQATGSGRLFVQGQEFVGKLYSLTCRFYSFQYSSPVENYRFILDPSGLNITLKILAVNNTDILKKYLTITCVDNG